MLYAVRVAPEANRAQLDKRQRRRHRSRKCWTHEILIAESMLALSEIGVGLPLAELYEGLAFPQEEEADR